MRSQTKKISEGHYMHVSTKKHISAHYGCSDTIWNIYNDDTLCDEFAIGFRTKSDAINYLNSLTIKK